MKIDVTGQQRRKTFLPEAAKLKLLGDSGDAGSFTGYGSVFGNIDSDTERMAPGAYAETLSAFIRDGFIGVGHDWKSGVATITDAREDQYGLLLEAAFHSDAESQMHRTRVNERLSRGKSVGLSVGFRILGYEWDEGDAGVLTITKADLYEVSIVTVPANSLAGVLSAKSGYPLPAQLPTTVREFEEWLREAGYSKSEAAQVASQGFKAAFPQRDSGGDEAAQRDAVIAAFLQTIGRTNTALCGR